MRAIDDIRKRIGPLWWYSALMFVFARLGDVVNLYVGMFLVPAVITRDRLGAILPLTSMAAFVSLPLAIVVQAALKYLSIYEAAGQSGKSKALLRDVIRLSLVMAVVVAGYSWFGSAFVQRRLKLESPAIMWLVAAVGVSSCVKPVMVMAAQGLKTFYRLIVSNLLAPLSRVVAMVLLLGAFQLSGYLAATLVSNVVVILFLLHGLRPLLRRELASESYRADWRGIGRYLVPVGVTLLVLTLQQAVEPWVIRQRLPALDSAGYYVAAMFGNIPGYLGGAIIPFLFPLVSEAYERGDATRRMHVQAVAVTFLMGLAFTLVTALAGGWILGLQPAWREYSGFSGYIWQVSLMTTLYVALNCHIMHESACRRFRYLWYLVPAVLLEVALLYGVMGWPFFRPWLPAGLWNAVNSVVRRDLQFVVFFMLASRALVAAGLAIDLALHRASTPAKS